MDDRILKAALRDLPLGGILYFDRTASTNDLAMAWAAEGASDLALVSADEQTAGRGRGNRKWITPPGTALAFSLILRPEGMERKSVPLFSGLGALAVAQALEKYILKPEIKWPNDVLLNRAKVCGVLAETIWSGEEVESVVMGIGVNVWAESVPSTELLNFPATSLETVLEGSQLTIRTIDRLSLLHDILKALLDLRPYMLSDFFLNALETRLAFRGEWVEIWVDGQPVLPGKVEGLERDGSLRLRSPDGKDFSIHFGDVHLRPMI